MSGVLTTGGLIPVTTGGLGTLTTGSGMSIVDTTGAGSVWTTLLGVFSDGIGFICGVVIFRINGGNYKWCMFDTNHL